MSLRAPDGSLQHFRAETMQHQPYCGLLPLPVSWPRLPPLIRTPGKLDSSLSLLLWSHLNGIHNDLICKLSHFSENPRLARIPSLQAPVIRKAGFLQWPRQGTPSILLATPPFVEESMGLGKRLQNPHSVRPGVAPVESKALYPDNSLKTYESLSFPSEILSKHQNIFHLVFRTLNSQQELIISSHYGDIPERSFLREEEINSLALESEDWSVNQERDRDRKRGHKF